MSNENMINLDTQKGDTNTKQWLIKTGTKGLVQYIGNIYRGNVKQVIRRESGTIGHNTKTKSRLFAPLVVPVTVPVATDNVRQFTEVYFVLLSFQTLPFSHHPSHQQLNIKTWFFKHQKPTVSWFILYQSCGDKIIDLFIMIENVRYVDE